jgi:hypothetical protein
MVHQSSEKYPAMGKTLFFLTSSVSSETAAFGYEGLMTDHYLPLFNHNCFMPSPMKLLDRRLRVSLVGNDMVMDGVKRFWPNGGIHVKLKDVLLEVLSQWWHHDSK